MKRLIINADDFGLLPGVNRAIIDTYHAGSITSTTLMMNMAATAEAVSMARQNPGLGVGLHCNLTCGFPLSPHSSSLVNRQTGRFVTRSELMWLLMTGRVRREHIENELRAQVKAFEATGLRLTHLDSHQHVHVLPPVFRVFATIARERGVPVRIPAVADLSDRTRLGGRLLKKSALHIMTLIDRHMLQTPANDQFLSIWDVMPLPDVITDRHYMMLLDRLGDGVTELMVHPAYVTPELHGVSNVVDISGQETKVLMNCELVLKARERNIEVVSYDALIGSRT